MSFDWANYLALAEQLMTKAGQFPDQESLYRSVTSRAYYACFGLVRNYLRDHDHQEFYSGNVHQALQIYLKNHPHQLRRKIGNQLEKLHQHRIKADYHDNLDELPLYKAGRALAQAKSITDSLSQLSGR
jgi:uncharacterized protein (UPF0332 family)